MSIKYRNSKPATQPQRDLVKRLLDQVTAAIEADRVPNADVVVETFLEPLSDLLVASQSGAPITMTEIQKVIEVLKAMVAMAAPDLSAPDHVSWAKVAGEWALKGAKDVMVEGATVTVRTKAGKESQVLVGTILSTEGEVVHALVGKAPYGVHHGQGDFEGQYIAVRDTRSGQQVGYRIEADGDHAYIGKAALEGLSKDTLLTLEEAKAVWTAGEVGHCCACGAQLTDPNSIAAGIGPVCAGKAFA